MNAAMQKDRYRVAILTDAQEVWRKRIVTIPLNRKMSDEDREKRALQTKELLAEYRAFKEKHGITEVSYATKAQAQKQFDRLPDDVKPLCYVMQFCSVYL